MTGRSRALWLGRNHTKSNLLPFPVQVDPHEDQHPAVPEEAGGDGQGPQGGRRNTRSGRAFLTLLPLLLLLLLLLLIIVVVRALIVVVVAAAAAAAVAVGAVLKQHVFSRMQAPSGPTRTRERWVRAPGRSSSPWKSSSPSSPPSPPSPRPTRPPTRPRKTAEAASAAATAGASTASLPGEFLHL